MSVREYRLYPKMTTTYANALWGGAATCGTAAPGSSFYTVIDETTKWGDLMMGDFGRPTGPAVSYKPYDPMDLYIDMAEYPWQYGDDMLDVWEPLDEQLRETDSQRVEAYWRDRDVREKAEQARVEERVQRVKRAEASRRAAFLPIAQAAAMKGARRWIDRDIKAIVARFRNAAIKIQAFARGYLVRCNNPHLDCCMCLSHRISPLKTEVGFMCRSCGNAGPFTEIVEGDGWNWFRAM